MTIAEALNVLHLDEDSPNKELVASLIDAIPHYIETTTGMPYSHQSSEPLCKTVGNFLLTLWYYADHSDSAALERTINNLLKCISIKARAYHESD